MSQSLIEYSTSESIKDSAKDLQKMGSFIIDKTKDIEHEADTLLQSDVKEAIKDICILIGDKCDEIIEEGESIENEINDIEDYEEQEEYPEPANNIRHTSIMWEAKDFRDIEIMETLDKLFYNGKTDVQILKLLEAAL